MPEIIPNLHPIFVHFTVALLTTAVGLHVLALLWRGRWREEWHIAARWNLWLGALVTTATVGAGIYAYNTVQHDALSHIAMKVHRNWALITAPYFLLLAIYSFVRYRARRTTGWGFVGGLLIGQALLGSTAWHGGELVYRYGLGVISLPKVEAHDVGVISTQRHNLGAAVDAPSSEESAAQPAPVAPADSHAGHEHQHSH